MTKFFKGKTKKQVTPIPRKLEEIKADYETLRNRSGDVQYQIFALERDLKQLNDQMLNVNFEAAARQQLDAQEVKEQQEVKEETNA